MLALKDLLQASPADEIADVMGLAGITDRVQLGLEQSAADGMCWLHLNFEVDYPSMQRQNG